MIYKRVFDHLRRQDWAAVAIEFLIVVAGVFLGMQVSNWNEARAEDARATAYLTRIHDDLMADVAAIDRSIAFVEQASAYADSALAYAEDAQLAEGSAWRTVLAFYQAGQWYPNLVADATYREMSYAGDLRLINDQQLSAALGAYYAGRAQSAEQLYNQLPAYRETIRSLTPHSVQRYIWANCYSQDSITDQRMIDCPAPISEQQAHALLRQFMAEPQPLRQLRFWTTQMGIQNSASTSERAAAADLTARVARALR